MAAAPETSFESLLAADSAFVVPTTDKEVTALLDTYGVSFKKNKGAAGAAARVDLLAGVVWLHMHHATMNTSLAVVSEAQQRRLAAALRLDYDTTSKLATWPEHVARRIVSQKDPGDTPKKRPAVDPALDGHGQIRKPGPPLTDVPPPADKSSKRQKASPAADADADPSDTGSKSSSSDDDSEPQLLHAGRGVPSAVPLAPMPSALGHGPAFDALVAARCARNWLPTSKLEAAIPAGYQPCLFRARLWPSKSRNEYDKMIKRQSAQRGSATRREDPTNVAFPHRLSFAFSGDESLQLDADHLRMVCAGERLSDWAGPDGRALGGQAGRAAFKTLLDELRATWTIVKTASYRLEHVGSPAIQNLFEQFLFLLERRYARFAAVLPAGRAREELLANIARQLGELQVYFGNFARNLSDRAARLPYDDQARFAGERYLSLLSPAMQFFLEADGGAVPGGIQIGAGGAPPSLATPAPAARRSILRTPPPVVSFDDSHASGGPAASPLYPPAEPAAPAVPFSMWPYFQQYPPVFAGAGGTPFPAPHPAASPVGAAPWSGYAGPISSSQQAAGSAALYSPSSATAPQPVRTKSEPGPKKTEKERFSSQPQHVWVTGTDCASVPAGEVRQPPCGCANHHGPHYRPGLHATWDCPLRYWNKYGRCPGFLSNGMRDPQQWLPGDMLTRAAKDAWLVLIAEKDLPLPSARDARAPPFHI